MTNDDEHNIDGELCNAMAQTKLDELFQYEFIEGYDPIAAVYHAFIESALILKEQGWSNHDLVDEIDMLDNIQQYRTVDQHRQCSVTVH